jgi:hypothetical protein
MYECRRSAILVTTECALWRYDNAFLFTNQSDVDFGNAYVQGDGLAPLLLNRALEYAGQLSVDVYSAIM